MNKTLERSPRLVGLLAVASVLFSGSALAQGTAVLFGTVTDAATKKPVPDVVVTITSPNLQGEQLVVTGSSGEYRNPQLPPGVYTLHFEKESYRPYSRSGIAVRLDQTVRLNVELLPEAIQGEEIVVVGRAPTVDVGATSTGMNVSSTFIRNLAVVTPGGKGSAARSFESLAELAPGSSVDTYGVSLSGGTSPENQYVVDGVSVNDPAFGINGSSLSVEFIQEVNVITGGYLPENGRSTGGVVNAVTKSGSNEFHGSVWGNLSPGALAGQAAVIRQAAGTISGAASLWNLGDFGAELGGPILKDKLWFYAGVAPSFTRFRLERDLNAAVLDANGQPRLDDQGYTVTRPLPGTKSLFFADQRTLQFIGKLTYLVSPDHSLTLSVFGTPTTSGGPGKFSLSERTGLPEVTSLNGTYESLATQRIYSAVDGSAKWSSSFLNKHLLLDATLGWHHQQQALRASDGTRAGSRLGLADISNVTWLRTSPGLHSIADFESLADPSACDPAGTQAAVRCPVLNYTTGGPGALREGLLNRYQGKVIGTLLLNAAGQHVIKAGVDAEEMRFFQAKAFSGRVTEMESGGGTYFQDFRQYGYLDGPDQYVIQDAQYMLSESTSIGTFVQDSWNLLDLVTVNVGLRHDSQYLTGAHILAMVLANEWSPRLGFIMDPTRSGRSKIYGSYARYYEDVPLDMVDRSFPGEPQIRSQKDASRCNPLDPAQQHGVCMQDTTRLVSQPSLDASRKWFPVGAGPELVDPSVKPQSLTEFVAGAEYEVFLGARAGATYTRRFLDYVVEDMSRDNGNTYFVGNPGYGFAKDFTKPSRTYDAVSVYFNKAFADRWLAQVSYTWSYLRGNYEGLFRAETGQLDPNINSDFDIISLLPNRTGPLPADHTHQIKAFGSKEFVMGAGLSFSLGLSYQGGSGAPTNYLGAHPDYGPGEAFILPRGSGPRLPWVHRIDSRLALNYQLSKDYLVTFSADVFNLFNFQAPIAVDPNYTYASVRPIVGGTRDDLATKLVDPSGAPVGPGALNPTFGRPTAYQAPRSFRFGARLSF